MKKIYTILVLLFTILTSNAQTADLQLVPTMNCTTNKLEVMVQIKAQTSTLKIGTSSILLSYNKSVLGFDSYQSESFDKADLCIANAAASWDDHVFDGTTAGTFNLTMTLLNNDFSCPEINTTWLNVGKITFNVAETGGNPELNFDVANTNFNSVPANDGTNPIVKGVFTGYSPATLGCACVKPIITTTDPSAICLPNTINLTNSVSGCTGTLTFFTDMAGTNPLTGSTASSSGTYYAKCTLASCYSDLKPIVVTINQKPPVPVITSDKSRLCPGSTAILTGSNCVGTVTWFKEDGSLLGTGSTFTVTTIGSYKAKCTSSGQCESEFSPSFAYSLGTVPSAPVISASTTSICGTETATLTSSCQIGSSLKWSNGSSTASITVSVAGTYNAICTNDCGDSPASNSVIITTGAKPAMPVVSGGKAICLTETATLTITGCTSGIKWYNGTTEIAGQTATTYVATTAGSYSATCSNACGESDKALATVVTSGTRPATPAVAGGGEICAGGSTMLATSNCSGAIKWYNGTTEITGQTGTSYTASIGGSFSATCSNSCGESDKSIAAVVTVTQLPATPAAVSRTNVCPVATINLSDLITSTSELYTDNTRAGMPLSASAVAAISSTSTYYLFNKSGSCYSNPATVSATIVVCQEPASIGNFVWNDLDQNGIQNNGEPGLAGVKVYLLNVATSSSISVNTDTQGKYSFTNLVPGDYSLAFNAPAGFMASPKNAGTNVTLDSDINLIDGSTVIFNLASAENDSTWDAGFYLPIPKGTIGDYVFNDVNNNGTQDTGDTPVGGMKIRLLNAAGLQIDSTYSNLDGSYNFNVVSGSYSLQFVAPAGRLFTAQNTGDATKDSDAASNGKTSSITIDTSKPVGDAARTITHLDAGLQVVVECVPTCIPISFKRIK